MAITANRENDMNDVDVIIAGGGIGGLASALALALAGQRVRVLERSSEFAEVGAGLQMAPNATRILRQWGILEKVTEAGVSPRRLVFRDALDGSVLTSAPLGAEFTARYQAPYVVIHRSDLLTILFEACRDAGVDLVPDCEVTDVAVFPDHVEVKTSAGPQRAAAAVAADGLRSALRRKFSDDEPICSGYVAYRGAFPVAQLDRQLESGQLEEVVVYVGPGRHLVQYPLRRGAIFNTVAVFASPAFRRDEAEWGGPDELDAAFAGSCEAVVRGLRSLWRDRRWPMFDRLPMDRWVDGRLALTGDAAHPMLQYLAQGACQAIEDAHCLAAEAEKSGGDWPAALARYAEIRFPRTSRVQRTARLWGDIWHVDGVSRLMRNELFRARANADFSRADWLYGT
jgi:2-polyprenyl-6-methoxyphenol hydroxylase-like FAD-dependent oxidoreductase